MREPAIYRLLSILMICAVFSNGFSFAQASEQNSTAMEAYRYLHENPELGGREYLAQAYLTEKLQSFGDIRIVKSEQAPTAVIGVFDTGRQGPTIALRSEMDARRLTVGTVEPQSHFPRSKINGLMHNCGHDVHSAMLLGAAERIVREPARFSGKIVFLFQPAEETPGGADDIVAEGILPDLGVEAIFAMHAMPGQKVGTAEITPGPALAGSNYFELRIKGDGSHAAAPFQGDDLPLTITRFVQELNHLPARRADIANRPFVLSVTRLIADSGAGNVIPTQAMIAGTVRAFEDIDARPDGQPSIRDLMTETMEGLAQAYGIEAELDLNKGSPPTINDASLIQRLAPVIREHWSGELKIVDWQGMFSEDFSYYTAAMPALYFSLGIAKDGAGEGGLHTPDFNIHPDTLTAGEDLFVAIAASMSTP